MTSLISTALSAGINVELYDAYSKISLSANTEFLLSSREFLKRSTHPVFYFVLNTNSRAITYFSESLSDCPMLYEDASLLFDASEYVILGVHGPITKNEFLYGPLNGHKKIIIANEEISEKFVQNNLPDYSVDKNVSYAKIKIPKQ